MRSKRLGTVLAFFFCIVSVTNTSCKKEDDDDTTEDAKAADKLEIGAVTQLKGLSDPATEFVSSDTSKEATAAERFDSLAIDDAALTATAGISLGSTTAKIKTAFGTTGSRAYCDTVNQGMKFFNGIGKPDLTLCILKKVLKNKTGIYDGNAHVMAFKGTAKMNGQEMPYDYKYKFKISAKDEKLSEFEAWICEGDSKGNYSQEQYQKQKLTGGEVTVQSIVTSKSSGTDESSTMTAQVNDDNVFVGLKNITYKENTDGDSPRFVEASIVQSPSNIRYVGYENTSGKINKYYSFAELIDKNDSKDLYSTAKLAYGSGAALIFNDSLYTKGWNGDTLAVDASSTYMEKTQDHSADLPSSTTAPTIKYSEAQTYDCAGDSDVDTSDVDTDDIMECAGAYMLDQEGSDMCSALSYQ